MVLCPNGTRPKENTPGIIIAAGAALEMILARSNPALAAFISLAAPFGIDSRVLCNGDPPPLPELTAFDYLQAATGQLSQNIKDLVLRYLWFQFCECVDAPTPPITYPPTPVDVPVYLPGPVLPCSSFSLEYRPSGDVSIDVPLYGSAAEPIGLVLGAKSVTVSPTIIARQSDPQACGTYNFTLKFVNAANTVVDTWAVGVGYDEYSTTEVPASHTINDTATAFYIFGQGGITGNLCTHADDLLAATFDFYCTTARTSTQPDCCPPDPAIAAQLQLLVDQVANILARLEPPGPLEELASGPISGEGSVGLAPGARQVNVQLETFGTGTALVPYAHPDRLIRAGTIRFGNAHGWRRREHVDNTDCLFAVPADATIVSWSLSPGTAGLLVQLGTPPAPDASL